MAKIKIMDKNGLVNIDDLSFSDCYDLKVKSFKLREKLNERMQSLSKDINI